MREFTCTCGKISVPPEPPPAPCEIHSPDPCVYWNVKGPGGAYPRHQQGLKAVEDFTAWDWIKNFFGRWIYE